MNSKRQGPEGKKKLKKQIDTAAGRKKAATVFKNARVLNVFTAEIIPGDVAVVDGEIVGIGNYTGVEEIDLKGKYLSPGLIDGHVHIESSMVSPREFMKVVLPRGTTSIVADPHEIANVRGLEGIRYMMDSSRDLPMNFYFVLPSCVPSTEFENAGAKLMAEDLATLIDRRDVLGLGELMDYPGVIGGRGDILDKVLVAGEKIIDGHGPEIKGHELNAYRMAGVKTEHECSTVEEMENRLRLGMYVLIRQGSAARNLEALIRGVTKENSRRCLFCTDDRHPEDLLTEGHIDNNVRQAIKLGLDPVTAVQMATINAAECYGLNNVGAIAPGRLADFVVLEDLESFRIHSVYKKGKPVQELLNKLPKDRGDTRWVKNSVNLHRVSLKDLQLQVEGKKIRAIKVLPHSLLTQREEIRVNLDKGKYYGEGGEPLLKMAVMERHHKTGNVGLGLVKDFHLENGAIALTIGHDSHNLIVIGDRDEDMLRAVKEVENLDGGIAIVSRGEVLAGLSLPIGGLMSQDSMEKVNEKFKAMLDIAYDQLKVNSGIDPFMTLSFLALPVIPEIKLTDMGLFDVTKFAFVDLKVRE